MSHQRRLHNFPQKFLRFLDIFTCKTSHISWVWLLGISLCNFLRQARKLKVFILYSHFWTLRIKSNSQEGRIWEQNISNFKELGWNLHWKKNSIFCKNKSGSENNIMYHTHTHIYSDTCIFCMRKQNNIDIYILHICMCVCV